ncbi:FecR domain-containing protein [Sulfidibacter corallicola]|uniref:FecR domain-containing protein n=1 Tax=Sulfidibacter corallicola TaxID=2818388 RepID=A0A8A4TEH5_SULCO|nr:FecR domain-containing protein [Sulfidibacter corallicola]QTD47947.1 FecR domain-containing protein [Sulfidibacter corallicola]
MTSFFDWLDNQSDSARASGGPADVNPHRESAGDETSEYADMKQLWEAAPMREMPPVPDTKHEWTRLRARMEEADAQRKSGFARFFRDPGARFAMALALLVLLAFGGWFLSGSRNQEPGTVAPYTVVTQHGEQQTFTLPDGSVVSLNAGSRLEVEPGFGNQHRRAWLEGEGFFEVQKGKIPFVVQTEQARIQVLGTVFNVFARTGLSEVSVREGRVEVSAAGQAVVLQKGQMTRCQAGQPPQPPNALPFENYPGWLEGELMVDGARLARVIGEIERRYDVHIRLADPGVGELKVTGLFRDKDPSDLIQSLCVLLDREYDREEGGFVIY